MLRRIIEKIKGLKGDQYFIITPEKIQKFNLVELRFLGMISKDFAIEYVTNKNIEDIKRRLMQKFFENSN